MRKKAAIGIAAIAALIGTPALAADVAAPPVPPPGWSFTGCYVGVNAGGAWANSAFNWANITESGTAFAPGAATVLPAAANADLDKLGFTGGGQVGCNYQPGLLVFGLEGDFEYTDLNVGRAAVSLGNTNGGPATLTPGNISESFSSNWLSTVRGRLGYASGAWLYYATGGLAVAKVNFADQLCFPNGAIPSAPGAVTPVCAMASSSNTLMGWTAGGGIEWKIAPAWNVKVEYLFVDLGNTSYTSIITTAAGTTPFPGATITHEHTLTENIVRIGLNYQFQWGPE